MEAQCASVTAPRSVDLSASEPAPMSVELIDLTADSDDEGAEKTGPPAALQPAPSPAEPSQPTLQQAHQMELELGAGELSPPEPPSTSKSGGPRSAVEQEIITAAASAAAAEVGTAAPAASESTHGAAAAAASEPSKDETVKDSPVSIRNCWLARDCKVCHRFLATRSEIFEHPLLPEVMVCLECYDSLMAAVEAGDVDDDMCFWCADTNRADKDSLVLCDSCPKAICTGCLHYVVGPEVLTTILEDDGPWFCPACDNDSIEHCRQELRRLLAWKPLDRDVTSKMSKEEKAELLEKHLEDFRVLKGEYDDALEYREEDYVETLRAGVVAELGEGDDAEAEIALHMKRNEESFDVLEARHALLKEHIHNLGCDAEALETYIFEKLRNETAKTSSFRDAGCVAIPDAQANPEVGDPFGFDGVNERTEDTETLSDQALAAKQSTDKALAQREANRLSKARSEWDEHVGRGLTLSKFQKMSAGAGGYTGPADRKWWYSSDVPADLQSEQRGEDRSMLNRIDQLVDVDEFEGDGYEACGQQQIPYQKIRDAFRNENRGHLSLVQKTNLKTYSKADDVQMRIRRKRIAAPIQKGRTDDVSDGDDENEASEREIKRDGRFPCTACQSAFKRDDLAAHPVFGVLMCSECTTRAQEGAQAGCAWCGGTKDLAACGSVLDESAECETRFCRSCVDGNKLSPTFDDICAMDEWKCFRCDPAPLKRLKDIELALDKGSALSSANRSTSKRRRATTAVSSAAREDPEAEEPLDSDDGESDEERFTRLASEGIQINTAAPPGEAKVAIHEAMSQMLKPHQVDGCRFLWSHVIKSLKHVQTDPHGGADPCGCVLAHCMGLGKTLQVIAFLHTVFKVAGDHIRTAMVVCPKNTIVNWHTEFTKWLSESGIRHRWKVRKLDGNDTSIEGRIRLLRKWSKKGGVLLITPDMFKRLAGQSSALEALLLRPGPDVLIVDEGHIYLTSGGGRKEPHTQVLMTLCKVKSKRRIVLTGTPLRNNLHEYYGLIDFVHRGLLGQDHAEYKRRIVDFIEAGRKVDATPKVRLAARKRMHVLQQKTGIIVHRRDFSVLEKDLPPKKEFVIYLRLTKVQRKLYRLWLADMARAAAAPKSDSRGSFFQLTQTLRKIVNHPSTLARDEGADDKKLSRRKSKAVRRQPTSSTTGPGWQTSSDESDDAGLLPSQWSTGTAEETKAMPSNAQSGDVTSMEGDNVTDSANPPSVDKGPKEAILSSPKEQIRQPQKPGAAEGAAASGEAHNDDDAEDDEGLGSLQQRRARMVRAVPEIRMPSIEQSSKVLFSLEIIRQSAARNERILFFSSRLDLLDLMQHFLEVMPVKAGETWQNGKHYHRLDGTDSADDRHHVADLFNSPSTDLRLLLLSTRAVGLGLNLIGASRVILFDLDWDPTVDMQAIFRTYRYGQLSPVTVYRLLSGKIDEMIYNRQVHKHQLFMTVVDKLNPERHFTDASFAEYRLDEDDIDSEPEFSESEHEDAAAAATPAAAVFPAKSAHAAASDPEGTAATASSGGEMIRDHADLSDDPILMRIAEDKKLTGFIRKVWSHDSFLLESGERDLTAEEKREAFAELETASSPPPTQLTQGTRKRKASQAPLTRRGKDKVSRAEPTRQGPLREWNPTALPFVHKYRKRKVERRAADKKKSEDLTKKHGKTHITIVFDSVDFSLQKNKLASPTDNAFKLLLPTFQKLSKEAVPEDQIGIDILSFGAENATPVVWDIPHSIRLDKLIKMGMHSNDGIMYLRLRHVTPAP